MFLMMLRVSWIDDGENSNSIAIISAINLSANQLLAGWWLTYPSGKYEFVSWDDEIPNRWKNNPTVPNHQPVS